MLTKNMLSGKPLQGTEIIIYVTNIEFYGGTGIY